MTQWRSAHAVGPRATGFMAIRRLQGPMRGLRSLSVIALCLVSLVTGGIAVRVVLLLPQTRPGSVLLGVSVLVLSVLWVGTRSRPATTAYW